jgi:hypothetical protein
MKIQCFFRSSPEFPVDGNSFRDFFRQAIRGNDPTFKVTDLEPKADLNLYTEGFYSTQFIESRGYTVPTFDDLLKGLKFLPTGLDARELTQCLVWYLNSADLFTPRLELNVLHVQSLVRALKLPLKDYGFRNLDIIGLNEFHEHDGYPNSRQADNERIVCNKETETDESRVKKKGYGVKDAQLGVEKGKHITLHIDSSNGTITTTVPISVRSIFQLPFMSMYGMVAVALRMGIENALTKKALRERSENGQNVEKPENDMNERPVQDFVSAHVEEKARLNLMSLIGAYKRTREDDGKDHGQQEGRPPKKVAIQPRCG